MASNLSESFESQPYCKTKETLLSKYQIPVQNLDFKYVEKCTNPSELEKILKILISGEEGYYPDLIKATEDRLAAIKPKSKLLRKCDPVLSKNDLNQDELTELSEDINQWVSRISKNNKELENRKTNENTNDKVAVRKLLEPEICTSEVKPKQEKRIKSTDYAAWDHYDPDTEILKMDISEETTKKAAMEEAKKNKPRRVKKTVSFNQFATETEAQFVSDRHKEKGNEFFKAGDFEDALQCYTNSITSKTTVTNLNNRAITYIKLKRYQLALDDCVKALLIEPDNLKSLLRKAQSLKGLKRYEEALKTVECVIQREPNNSVAQELADKVRNHCGSTMNNTRMKIIEIQ